LRPSGTRHFCYRCRKQLAFPNGPYSDWPDWATEARNEQDARISGERYARWDRTLILWYGTVAAKDAYVASLDKQGRAQWREHYEPVRCLPETAPPFYLPGFEGLLRRDPYVNSNKQTTIVHPDSKHLASLDQFAQQRRDRPRPGLHFLLSLLSFGLEEWCKRRNPGEHASLARQYQTAQCVDERWDQVLPARHLSLDATLAMQEQVADQEVDEDQAIFEAADDDLDRRLEQTGDGDNAYAETATLPFGATYQDDKEERSRFWPAYARWLRTRSEVFEAQALEHMLCDAGLETIEARALIACRDREMHNLIRSMTLLPIPQRRALALEMAGYQQAEIAARIHLSQSTVSRYLRIAKGEIAQMF